MTKVNDILVDSQGVVLFKEGDFFVGYSDSQHVNHIVLASAGDYKQSPLVGVGIVKWLNAPIDLVRGNNLKGVIMLQLKADGYKVSSVKIGTHPGDIKIEAER